MPYQGILFVENNDFELNAERLIARESEAAFKLCGPDTDGNGIYSIEGVARRMPSGSYESENLPIKYEGYGIDAGVDRAVIFFSRIDETREGCEIEGEWRQDDGQCWGLSGLLEPFDA